MFREAQIREACEVITQGGVVAYPTEAVYGLGCDPCNHGAVLRVAQIKSRGGDKPFILIASDMSQLAMFCDMSKQEWCERAQATWPGPYTWVFPASGSCPQWLCQDRASVAVRVSAHPIVIALCATYGGALVSTSANVSGSAPAVTAPQVEQVFGDAIDYIVEGETGGLARPTVIRDVISGRTVRE